MHAYAFKHAHIYIHIYTCTRIHVSPELVTVVSASDAPIHIHTPPFFIYTCTYMPIYSHMHVGKHVSSELMTVMSAGDPPIHTLTPPSFIYTYTYTPMYSHMHVKTHISSELVTVASVSDAIKHAHTRLCFICAYTYTPIYSHVHIYTYITWTGDSPSRFFSVSDAPPCSNSRTIFWAPSDTALVYTSCQHFTHDSSTDSSTDKYTLMHAYHTSVSTHMWALFLDSTRDSLTHKHAHSSTHN